MACLKSVSFCISHFTSVVESLYLSLTSHLLSLFSSSSTVYNRTLKWTLNFKAHADVSDLQILIFCKIHYFCSQSKIFKSTSKFISLHVSPQTLGESGDSTNVPGADWPGLILCSGVFPCLVQCQSGHCCCPRPYRCSLAQVSLRKYRSCF